MAILRLKTDEIWLYIIDFRHENAHITRPFTQLPDRFTAAAISKIKSATIQELFVANTPQARKRARQAETHRQRKAGQRSMLRTAIKKVVYAIEAGDKSAAETAYKAATPIIDSAANKGLIHANKAARHKSRLNTAIRAMS